MAILLAVAEQEGDIVFGKLGRRRGVFIPQRVGERGLALLERQDILPVAPDAIMR